MAVGLGFSEILLLVLLMGDGPKDLVSFLDAKSYFQRSEIPTEFNSLVAVARQDPAKPAKQIQQLVALKYLTENADSFKKDVDYAAHRKVIEQIASGEKAQDPAGFSKHYAARLLRALDGAKPPPRLLYDPRAGLDWIPADVEIAGGIDFRNSGTFDSIDAKKFTKLFQMIPARERDKIFDFVDQCGNVQIERINLAFKESGKGGTLYMRYSGKGRQAWVLEAIKKVATEEIVVNSKQEEGVTVSEVYPALGSDIGVSRVVGDTEVLFAFNLSGNDKPKDAMDKMLNVRAKKTKSVQEGMLKDSLDKISPKAFAFGVTNLSENLINKTKNPLFAMPSKVQGQVVQGGDGLEVDVQGVFANDQEAKTFVMTMSGFRDQAVQGVKQLRNQPLPFPFPIDAAEKVLDSIQLSAQGSGANLKMLVGNDYLASMMNFAGAVAEPAIPKP